MRQHVVPANPQTAEQSKTRNAFQSASLIWKLAGPLLRAPWNRYAVGQVLVGRNAFMGRFVSDLRGAADMTNLTMSPGAKGGLSATSIVAASPGAGEIDVTVTAPAPPAGWVVTQTVAAILPDDDPAAVADGQSTEDTGASGVAINFAGLTAGDYAAAGWIEWEKPDGSVAYSASETTIVTVA